MAVYPHLVSLEAEHMDGKQPMSNVCPISTDKDSGEKSEKLEKLGMLCMSLGLQPSRMTDKMLDKIELSKHIERDQRKVIKKLSSESPLEEKGEARKQEAKEDEEEERERNEDSEEGEKDRSQSLPDADGESGLNDMQLNTLGKSLKRRKIPPPLSISESNSAAASVRSSAAGSATSYQFDPDNSLARSAPAHISNFPRSTRDKKAARVDKPSVQYLGRVSTNGPRRNSPIQSTNAYKLKTPYVTQFPRYPMPGPPPPTMTPCAPYYPFMYPPQFPMYQSTPQQPYSPAMLTPWQPRSAMPYSSQARYYQDSNPRGKRVKKQNRDQPKKPTSQRHTQDVRASDPDDSSDDPADRQPEESANNDEDDTESVHLAIEDNAEPLPSREPQATENVQGEVRISGNVFSYEFPCNNPGIDKKMFMSICDKVWDESKRLAKNFPP